MLLIGYNYMNRQNKYTYIKHIAFVLFVKKFVSLFITTTLSYSN